MIPNQIPALDFGLGETADMLRDTVMSFAADRIAPRADEIDRTNQFPRDLWLATSSAAVTRGRTTWMPNVSTRNQGFPGPSSRAI